MSGHTSIPAEAGASSPAGAGKAHRRRRTVGGCLAVATLVALSAGPVRSTSPPPTPRQALGDGLILRVGIETDRRDLVVACCQEGLVVSSAEGAQAVGEELRIVPAGEATPPIFRLQAVALKDEDQSIELASRLAALLSVPADSTFDVTSSLYRVRVGRFATREEAEAFQRRVVDKGLTGAWVVSEGGQLLRPRLRLESAGGVREVAGRWLALESDLGAPVAIGERTYRGRILVFLNERGSLNLVNELDLESYLRGVVPLEMGPELYDNLESLKAQAVAARTFAVKSFGGFEDEGFDVCAAPRCQVYGGVQVEHPLSDRAIAETAHEVVVYEGEIAEALYSSSCGGATEDVETVFPHKLADYLRGVPCPEAGSTRLGVAQPAGASLAAGLMGRLVPVREPDLVAGTESRLKSLARLANIDPPPDSLASVERTEVRRFLASIFDLAVDPRLLRGSTSVDDGWSTTQRRFHARFVDGVAPRHVAESELEDVLLDLARLLGLVREQRAYFLRRHGSELELRVGGEAHRISLPDAVATFTRRGPELVSGPAELAAGDRLRLFRGRDGALIAIAREGETSGRSHARQDWSHFRSRDRLRRSVSAIYPGFELERLEVVSRGVSNRVEALRLHATDGETVLVEGLAVRWTLDLPDTLFEVQVTRRDGQPGWTFEGRGHGHGVGMCQIGAVVMGRRGQTYREILAHYYTGAQLGRLKTG